MRIAALVREARLFHEPDLVAGEEEDELTSRRVDLFPGRREQEDFVLIEVELEEFEELRRILGVEL